MEEKSAYLDLTVISAADLKRNWLSGDRTVVVAWVDPSAKKTTSSVTGSGSNVQWDEKLLLSLNGVDNLLHGMLLTIEIHARGMWGNSLLGSVYVPLAELGLNAEKRGKTTWTYEIIQPSGRRQGSMSFLARVLKPRAIGSIGPLSGSVTPVPSAPCIGFPEDDCTWQCNTSQDSSYGMSFYPPHVYPPINTTYPPHVYPPINTTYPLHTPPVPCSSHSNSLGIVPYPPPTPSVLESPYPPPASVYPPPPTLLFSETSCLPIAPYPPTAPHPSQIYSAASYYSHSNFSTPLHPTAYPQRSF